MGTCTKKMHACLRVSILAVLLSCGNISEMLPHEQAHVGIDWGTVHFQRPLRKRQRHPVARAFWTWWVQYHTLCCHPSKSPYTTPHFVLSANVAHICSNRVAKAIYTRVSGVGVCVLFLLTGACWFWCAPNRASRHQRRPNHLRLVPHQWLSSNVE